MGVAGTVDDMSQDQEDQTSSAAAAPSGSGRRKEGGGIISRLIAAAAAAGGSELKKKKWEESSAPSKQVTSRLVVKNLPKSITELKLRRHFESSGNFEITDIRLGRWNGTSSSSSEGTFRGFAYIGFKSEEEAARAKEHFHRSFVGGGRVDVEFWVPRDERERVLSKRAKREGKVSAVEPKKVKKSVEESKRTKLEEEILARAKDDKDFAEFLGAHNVKKGGRSQKWANDDDVVGPAATAKGKKATDDVTFDESSDDSSSDDDESAAPNQVMTSPDAAAASPTTTPPGKKTSSKKTDLFTLKLVDLPRSARKSDLRKLFSQFSSVSSIRLPRNSRGFGFVGFRDEAEGRRAIKMKDKSVVKGSVVRVKVYQDKNKSVGSGSAEKAKKLEGVESVGESGRIYVRNLGYDVSEEELRTVFGKFGPLVEVFIPIDSVSGKNKGFGFVTFMIPGDAERAMQEIDGRGVVQGRILHLLPAREKVVRDEGEEAKTFKQKRLKGKKVGEAEGSHKRGWNTLFVNPVAVSDLMSKKYGVEREEFLLSSADSSAGVRLALGEAEIVSSVEKFLVSQGVCLAAFEEDPKRVVRSKNIILVRNLPVEATEEDLRTIFSKYGELGRVLVPEYGVCGLVEFKSEGVAKKAFKGEAYSRFKGGSYVLFLEWAPVGVFLGQGEELSDKVEESNKKGEESSEKKPVAESAPTILELPRVGQEELKLDAPEEGTTLFVKNLSWETREERVREVFSELGPVYAVKLALKKVGDKMLSQGYGFVQFWRRSDAVRALGVVNGKMVDNHTVEVKESKKSLVEKRDEIKKKGEESASKTVISVKNVPFQASQEEVAELFKVFGVLKGVRMPLKVLGEAGHRGFAFVEFVKEEGAKAAMDALGKSCHLYGRRLVLSWAEKSGKDNVQLEEEVERRRMRAKRIADTEGVGGVSSTKKGIKRYFDNSGLQQQGGDSD